MKVNGKDMEGLSHILWKIKNVWNHQPVMLSPKKWCKMMWDKQQTKTKKLWKVNIWISQSATICSKTRRVWILTESSSTVSQSSLQQPLCITPKHTGWSLHNSQKLPARFISHPIYHHLSIFHPIFIAKNNRSFIGSLSSTIIHIWLVVEPYPSEKWWSSSVGMMTFPTEWKVIKVMFQSPSTSV